MEEVFKKNFQEEPEGSQCRGRPRTEGVKQDLKQLKMENFVRDTVLHN